MDFSANNYTLWGPIIQIGVVASLVILANILRRKVKFIQKAMIPTAVLAGFLLLFLRTSGFTPFVTMDFLESMTYHTIALGFIAMSLRTPDRTIESERMIGSKSGALIVSTYLVQAITGLAVSLFLAYTFMPDLFKASGVLLPMAYGQGPGQANNVGLTYEKLGMTGGASFGLSLAAAGYLCACIVGVIFINIYSRKGKLTKKSVNEDKSNSVTIDTFQDKNEIPISESIDKLSIQIAFICLIYLLTFLLTWGLSELITFVAPGLGNTVTSLLWGFNFIIGSTLAVGFRTMFTGLRKVKLMNHQYQNNYLLSRISGLLFDVMIITGIASIDINDLANYWAPFLLMAALGGAATFVFLKFMSKKLYKGYEHEGFFSMYGMLTGTVSSGVLLLREIDPNMKTPASNNMITGSSFAIIFGIPMLILVGLAPQSDTMTLISFGLVFVYLLILLLFIFKVGRKKKIKK